MFKNTREFFWDFHGHVRVCLFRIFDDFDYKIQNCAKLIDKKGRELNQFSTLLTRQSRDKLEISLRGKQLTNARINFKGQLNQRVTKKHEMSKNNWAGLFVVQVILKTRSTKL